MGDDEQTQYLIEVGALAGLLPLIESDVRTLLLMFSSRATILFYILSIVFPLIYSSNVIVLSPSAPAPHYRRGLLGLV